MPCDVTFLQLHRLDNHGLMRAGVDQVRVNRITDHFAKLFYSLSVLLTDGEGRYTKFTVTAMLLVHRHASCYSSLISLRMVTSARDTLMTGTGSRRQHEDTT